MANNYLLKYKTFDELLADVLIDFRKYNTNGMINTASLIKVVQKINKRLGNKLRKEKETMLYVEKGRVRLPSDFHKHRFAVMCYDYSVTSKVIQGSQREIVSVDSVVPLPGCEAECPPCRPCVRLDQCGKEYQIIETTNYETRKYSEFGRLEIKSGKTHFPSQQECNMNLAYIENNFLHTNFDEGKIYFVYLGNMEDEDGNLIVLDHELINAYYEYSLKKQIIENLMVEGETIPQNLFQVIQQGYMDAQVEANSVINMPDFAEMELAHNLNREAKYRKFYHIFK